MSIGFIYFIHYLSSLAFLKPISLMKVPEAEAVKRVGKRKDKLK